MLLRVVDEDDVEAVEARTRVARIERAEDAVAGIVVLEPIVDGEPADLRRDGECVSLHVGEYRAEPALAETGAVERRRVERADTELPRRVDCRRSVLVADRPVRACDSRAAEAEAGDGCDS
jgi:hypothetical protein